MAKSGPHTLIAYSNKRAKKSTEHDGGMCVASTALGDAQSGRVSILEGYEG